MLVLVPPSTWFNWPVLLAKTARQIPVIITWACPTLKHSNKAAEKVWLEAVREFTLCLRVWEHPCSQENCHRGMSGTLQLCTDVYQLGRGGSEEGCSLARPLLLFRWLLIDSDKIYSNLLWDISLRFSAAKKLLGVAQEQLEAVAWS